MSERSNAPLGDAVRSAAPAGGALLLARGVPALLVGLVTTFTGGHSPVFGLIAVALWGVVSGAAEAALLVRMPLRPAARSLELARAAAVVVTGLAAAGLAGTTSAAALVYVIGVGALAIGGLDLAAGLRDRGAPLAREWTLHGGITLLMGVLALVVPPNLAQPYSGAAGHGGLVTASVVVVGFFGAWGIVIGVLSLIGAVGQRTQGAER